MKFRKKPVEIEAWQFTGQHRMDWPEPYASDKRLHAVVGSAPAVEGVVIDTLEGQMLASKGDWIIIGVKGEVYPCKPDIFEMTYEPVE